MVATVKVFEVGPRDGLQNEAQIIQTAQKVKLTDMLTDGGFSKIEVTSFVSPRWVPQMADAAQVMAGIVRKPDIDYSVLTPNMRGLQAAIEARADEVAIFASASEGFSQKNVNCSVQDSLRRFEPLMAVATQRGIRVRGYVSCITQCPYDGEVIPSQVARVVDELIDMGCYEISLGDTLGVSTQIQIERLLETLLESHPAQNFAGHFHDKIGGALENIGLCLDAGIRVFDAAIGGLGGCPYAPGAKGNVATEAVVAYLEQRGHNTGIDLEKLGEAARFAKTLRTAP